MAWLQVRVETPADEALPIEEALIAAGAQSVTLEDAGDIPLLEPAPGETPLWQATRVVALFDEAADREHVSAALSQIGDAGLTPEFESLPEREWTRVWMDDWQPLRFGRRLWVAPLHAPVEEPGAVTLRLDPGLAFGTGTHATTALCLEWLDGETLTGCNVLDYGCGSGILAIAALLLGARHALGVDIDPQALEATRTNARTNEVSAGIATAEAGTDPDPGTDSGGPFDVIVANILAGPLIQAAPELAGCQQAGGRIVLAGVLAEQADDVIAAYDRWYSLTVNAEREEWVRIQGQRRAARQDSA